MRPISYFNLETLEGKDEYVLKANENVELFEKIFRVSPDLLNQPRFKIGGDENGGLLKKISEITGIPTEIVQGVNCADEALNAQDLALFGCTAVGIDGVVGQTLDLFTVDLSIVSEKDALYITMPPYLTLMGMSKNLAFCTNYIPGSVKKGVLVSHLRRNLLRQKSLDEAVNYLKSVERTTNVNFLITDGKKVVDAELTPEEVILHDTVFRNNKFFFVHTNHLLNDTIFNDSYCPRLKKTVRMVQDSKSHQEIFDAFGINMPVCENFGVGFGSIVKVVMDVKNKTLSYKDTFMDEYKKLEL